MTTRQSIFKLRYRFRNSRIWAIPILTLSCLLSSQSFLSAQNTYNWAAPTSKYWTDTAAWSPGGVPGINDSAIFGVSGTSRIYLNANQSVGSMKVSNGNVWLYNTGTRILTINGSNSFSDFEVTGNGTLFYNHGSKLVSNGGASIGSGSTFNTTHYLSTTDINGSAGLRIDGTMNLTQGTVTNTNGFVGLSSGSTGIANVASNSSGYIPRWYNNHLYLGGTATTNGGVGTLNIGLNGKVYAGDDTPGYSTTQRVLSIGSTDLNSGGTVWVRNGSTINNSSGYTYVGDSTGKVGELNVSGSGSTLSDSTMYLGNNGQGHVNVTNGGVINSTTTHLGTGTTGQGSLLVAGSGSQFNGNTFYNGRFGTGSMVINNGGYVSGNTTLLGYTASGNGTTTVNGSGSHLDVSTLSVGYRGTGILNVQDGGLVSGTNSILGDLTNSSGTVNVTGSGSQLNLTSNLEVGRIGTGNLMIQDGGVVSNLSGIIRGTSSTATVSGPNSQWNNSNYAYAQAGGTLNVNSGGQVNSVDGYLATNGSATVSDANSHWNQSGNFYLGYASGNGTMLVNNGGMLTTGQTGYLGTHTAATGIATITGTGSVWNSDELQIGQVGNGTLNISAGGVVSSTATSTLGNSSTGVGITNISGTGSQWNLTDDLDVGVDGNGTINLNSGGVLASQNWLRVGINSGATGTVNIDGTNSQISADRVYLGWQGGSGQLNVTNGGQISNTDSILLGGHSSSGSSGLLSVDGPQSNVNASDLMIVGWGDNGTLLVTNGGNIENANGYVGHANGSTGIATINGAGSQWHNSNDLVVANSGDGTLNIQSGGLVSNANGIIGKISGRTGIVNVQNSGSHWQNSGNLNVGIDGTATLNITDHGLVSVGGTTSLGSGGTINLNGGRLEFGTTTLAEFAAMDRVSGSMSGQIHFNGLTDLATIGPFQGNTADISEVQLVNAGTLYGQAFMDNALNNSSSGELRTMNGQWQRFAGSGNTNAGEINNLSGIVEFENDLTNLNGGEINNFGGTFIAGQIVNEAGGFISGRGEFLADGGWTNSGIIATSGGFSDIHGDVVNTATGQIAIGGGSTTTFFDDVTMDASNMDIDVSENSHAVFFGSYNGGNAGLGTVHAFGDLRPGNSPAVVSFGGDLEMAQTTSTLIELAGLSEGEFDKLIIDGDLKLDGLLNVETIDGFLLGQNQSFLITEVEGERFGFFDNFAEGDSVGNFNGIDLYITYTAGNGNDIALFSAVPEPAAAPLIAMIFGCLGIRRKRRKA